MLDKLLSSLQGIPAYSILISAVVVIFIAVSVLVMFGTGTAGKRNRTASLGKGQCSHGIVRHFTPCCHSVGSG